MTKKKSYMSSKNVISEGMFDKLMCKIVTSRWPQVERLFKDNPELKKQAKKVKDAEEEFEKAWKKAMKLQKKAYK